MIMLWDMWRAIRAFLQLELEQKIKEERGFPVFGRKYVWVPRSRFSAYLLARYTFRAMLHEWYGTGRKKDRFLSENNIMDSREEKAEKIIDNLIDYKFLDVEDHKWEPERGMIVAMAEGESIYHEVIKITPKGDRFAGSLIILFRYMREEAGIGLGSVMLVLVGAIAAAIVMIGVFTGSVVIPNIMQSAYEWGCDMLKLSCQIRNDSINF